MIKRDALTLSLCLFPSVAFADAVNFVSSGSDEEVIAAVNAFRAAVGEINSNQPGSFIGGRREINWDGAPDEVSSPNAFPFNFFNANTPGRARGVEFFTPGEGFLLSADSSNPANAAVNFGDINPAYGAEFRPFTQQRLFAAAGSTTCEVRFFIPGQSNTRAHTSAFGVVFTDVDIAGSTRIDYIDEQGTLLHSINVPPSSAGQGGFSFAGCVFNGGERIWRVVITSGNAALGADDNPGAGVDVVVMDDFLYAEPVPATNPRIFASGGDDAEVTAMVDAFRAELGELNANNPGSVGSGRREINWDGVPDASSSPNALPGDFFNGANPGRARGVVFTTPGSGFEVSADSDNPTGTPPEFAHIEASYADNFRAFTPERLFAPIGSTITTTTFFVPGSNAPADSAGFGAVFSDVDLPVSAKMEWLDRNGGLLASYFVPVGSGVNESFSFLGLKFDEPYRVASVRIVTGTIALGAREIPGETDVVVMDDFIYGEPVALAVCAADLDGSGAVNSADFFLFLTFFFTEDLRADFDENGIINSNDFYVFVTSFFLGC